MSHRSGNPIRVLVTGGAGYIGSHAAKALAQAGLEPVVFDDLRSGHRDAVRWGPFVEASLDESDAILDVLARYRPVAVMHFAASAYVGESVREPADYYRNNIANTLNLLDAMRSSGVDRIVFSSSCASYGRPIHVPIDEAHPQTPINPYGRTKLIVERMLDDFGHAYGLRSVALRYFNAAGADPDGELGERHDPETHLVPLAILTALGRNAALQVFGCDYPTGDGTAVRDFVHVSDLAAAHVLALRHLLDDGDDLRLNLGVGRGYSVREVVDAVERVSGGTVRTVDAPRREGDPAELVADARLASRTLDWRPRHSDLDEIVRTAWQWHVRGEASRPPVEYDVGPTSIPEPRASGGG